MTEPDKGISEQSPYKVGTKPRHSITITIPTPLPEKKTEIPVVVRFGAQILTGALVFALIASVAVALNFGVRYLERQGVSEYILFGLQGVEFLLFALDVISIVVFVGVETISLIKAMISNLRGE